MWTSSGDPVREEYARLAGRYDRRWSNYIDATTRETLRRMRVRPGDRVLDVGCGTGVLVRLLSERGPDLTVTGLDSSREMLVIAGRRMSGRVAFLEGSVARLPFPEAAFDVAVSVSAFHYFREPLHALHELKRVLRVGGRLIVTDWCDDYLTCRICDLLLRRLNQAHFRTYRTAECRALLEESGFARVGVERYKINWLWGLMTATGEKDSA